MRQRLGQAHVQLGEELRRVREEHGATTYEVPGFSPGHVSSVETGHAKATKRFVETYVRLWGHGPVLRALFEQAAAETQEGKDRGASIVPDSPPQNIEEVTDHGDVTRHYVVETYDVSYGFDSDGAIREIQCAVAIRAKSEGVTLFYTGYIYSTDRRPGVLRVEDISEGATEVHVRESETGAIQAYFVLDRELSTSDREAHTVAFRILVNTTIRARPLLQFHNTHGAKQLVLRAQFQAPSLPWPIWWFEVADTVDAEHPTDERLKSSPRGYYRRSFNNLVPGWCYGLGWVWPE